MTEAGNSQRSFVGRVLVVLALAALALMLWQLRSMLLLAFGAVVVAVILRAIATPIARRTPLGNGMAVAASVAIVLGLLGVVFWLFGAQITGQLGQLTSSLPDAWNAVEQRLADAGLGGNLQRIIDSAGDSAGAALSQAGQVALTFGGGVADALVVLVGGIYLAAQPGMYRRGAIRLVPLRRRDAAKDALDRSGESLRMWLKGQLISMVLVGTLTGLGLWLIGVPAALALALLAALLEFIPLLGPIIAAVPAVLLALAQEPEMALWVAGLYLVVQQIEGNVLQPLVQQYAVDLPPVILLFSLLGFGTLFGFTGVLLAAPLTVVVYVLVKRLYVEEALEGKPASADDDDDD